MAARAAVAPSPATNGTSYSRARLDQIQGSKARYKGTRKNTLDVRRCATVANLQSLARIKKAAWLYVFSPLRTAAVRR